MHWFVYILKCSDNTLYTGITWNLKKKVTEHNSGKFQNFTISRLPVKSVHWEGFSDKLKAAKRKKEIKGWRREKKDELINSLR